MTLDRLVENHLSDEALAFVTATYTATDSFDLAGFGAGLAENCTLVFGNGPKAEGKEAILQGIQHFWETIQGMNHHFVRLFQQGHTLLLDAEIDYTRTDGRVVNVNCITAIERNETGLATAMRIYLDLAPVFA